VAFPAEPARLKLELPAVFQVEFQVAFLVELLVVLSAAQAQHQEEQPQRRQAKQPTGMIPTEVRMEI
jgi:hypothetical protein